MFAQYNFAIPGSTMVFGEYAIVSIMYHMIAISAGRNPDEEEDAVCMIDNTECWSARDLASSL